MPELSEVAVCGYQRKALTDLTCYYPGLSGLALSGPSSGVGKRAVLVCPTHFDTSIIQSDSFTPVTPDQP